MKRLFYYSVAVMLLATACGGSTEPRDDTEPASATGPPLSAPDPSTTSTSSPPSDGAAAGHLPDRSVITQEDNGSSFTTRLGNRIELQLSGDYLWSGPEIAGPAQLVPINFVDDPGFTAWEVLIEEAGTVTISARGSCADGTCDPADVEFRVTIEVTAG